MVFSNVNVKGYINLKLAELNFKDRSPQTAYQLFFMPVSGDEKKLYQEHYALQFNKFHDIIKDTSLLSINVTANKQKITLTNLIRNGLYKKAGLVQHFAFICTSFESSVAWDTTPRFNPNNIELRLRWNIKCKFLRFLYIFCCRIFQKVRFENVKCKNT